MIKTLLNIQQFAEPKSFMANLQDLINKSTLEGGDIDWAKANEEIGLQVTNYNRKVQPNIEDLKREAADTVKNDFIKGMNITGVATEDQFKAYVNSVGSDELKVKNQNLTTQVKEWEDKYNDVNNKYTSTSKQLTTYNNEKFLLGKNASVEDVDYLSYKISSMVTDELPFDKAYEVYAKENPRYFGTEDRTNKTTGKPRVIQPGVDYKDPIERILEEKGKIR